MNVGNNRAIDRAFHGAMINLGLVVFGIFCVTVPFGNAWWSRLAWAVLIAKPAFAAGAHSMHLADLKRRIDD